MIPHRAGNANFFLEQWERVKRWKNQCCLQVVDSEGATLLDFYEAFFINAYHLKDWLTQWLLKNKHDDILKELRLDFKNKIFLKILRDICNGEKHFTLEKNIAVGKQYVVINEYVYGGGTRRVILIGGYKYPLIDLREDIFNYWYHFFKKFNLDKLNHELYPYIPFD